MASDRETVDAKGAAGRRRPVQPRGALRGAAVLLGQIPLHPGTGEIVGDSPAEQARRCLENLALVCEAAGTTLARALRMTVYMTDLAAFAEVNEVYGSFLGEDPPARVAIGVAALPRGAQVEIDAIVAV